MTFKDLISQEEFTEAFNSSYEITKVKKYTDYSYYYFNTETNKEYRVLVEFYKAAISISFHRHINNEWIIHGVTSDLTMKESLTLFGTIKKIVQDFGTINTITIRSKEDNKKHLYRKILESLQAKYNLGDIIEYSDRTVLYSTSDISANMKNPINKRKWKIK